MNRFWTALVALVSMFLVANTGFASRSGSVISELKRTCYKGDMKACNNLAHRYEKGLGVVKRDEKRALMLYNKACTGGAAGSCFNMGILLFAKGKSSPEDQAEAVGFYRKACEKDHPGGCFNLAYAYSNGTGIGKHKSVAARYYQKACSLKSGSGCLNLANMLRLGAGVPKDEKRAAELFSKACDLGQAKGCTELGKMHAFGEGGMAVSNDSALVFLDKGCKLKDKAGCVFLGTLRWRLGQAYEKKTPKRKKPVAAIMYYMRACHVGNKPACDRLGVLGKKWPR
jgi:hypothetical protein